MADSEQITHPRQVKCSECGAFPGWACSTRDAKRRVVRLRYYHRARWDLINHSRRKAS